jgi:hypothetical protein
MIVTDPAVCSFCGTHPVVAWFEGPRFVTWVAGPDEVRADEAWLTCASCLRLVERGDRARIATRGTRRVGGSSPDDALVAVRGAHERFWSARGESSKR